MASAIPLQLQFLPDASSFERKHSICKKENAYWVMEKKMKEGGYRLLSTERNDRKWKKERKESKTICRIIHLNGPLTCCDPFDEWEDQLGFSEMRSEKPTCWFHVAFLSSASRVLASLFRQKGKSRLAPLPLRTSLLPHSTWTWRQEGSGDPPKHAQHRMGVRLTSVVLKTICSETAFV